MVVSQNPAAHQWNSNWNLSVNENSKTNSNPKKRKSDRTGKKTMMLSILRLETNLLKLLKNLKLLV